MPTKIYSDNKQFTKQQLQRMQQVETLAHSTSTTNLAM